MSSYNKVILMGNLCRDPELRHTQSGMAICAVGLAVNEKFKDAGGEWQERTTFVDLTIWGKRGEAFAKFHRKGSVAFVEGKLRLDQWDDKQTGQKRSKLFVSVDNWEFAGGGEPKQQSNSWGGGQAGNPQPKNDDGWGSPAAAASDSFDDTPF